MNDIDPRPYKERLETVHDAMADRLHGRYASEAEFENTIGFGYDYSSEL